MTVSQQNRQVVRNDQAPDVLAPAQLGPVQLRNRIIKAATYEGLSRDGMVTDDLIDFHVRHAAGGLGMTTLAFCAVAPEGRSERHEVQWLPENVPGLRKLTDAVHAEGAAVSAQLGHSGPVANPKVNGSPALAPSRIFHKTTLSFTKAASQQELRRIVTAHADAARMAADTGFDAVEIHLGHNYLASTFLSPKFNRRTDAYGGSLENRARLSLEIVRAVREAVGNEIAVLAKLNMDDGVPGGLWLDEAIPVARWLEETGALDALELTVGSSLANPMYLFKGDAPIREFAEVMPQPLKAGIKLLGNRVLPSYPYRDAYLLDDARQIRAAVDMPLILLGGVTDKPVMDQAMAEGFQYVAMARALLREPDLINRIQADETTPSLCIHCNKCMAQIYGGTRCVLVEHESPRGKSQQPAAASTEAGA